MITAIFVCIIGARANKPTALHPFGLETAFVNCVIRIESCIGETCSSRARTTQTAAGDCQAEVQKSVKGIILFGARKNYAQSHSQCSLGLSLFFLIPKVDSLFHLMFVLGPPLLPMQASDFEQYHSTYSFSLLWSDSSKFMGCEMYAVFESLLRMGRLYWDVSYPFSSFD